MTAPLLALVTTIYCLLVVIPEAYTPPPLISEQEIPAGTTRARRDLGSGLELLAYDVETFVAEPGDLIWLTLYWRSNDQPDEADLHRAPEYVIEVFGRDDELVGKLQSYHGGGLYPATLWTPGTVVEERVAVRLNHDLTAPTQVRLIAGLAGGQDSVEVGAVKVAPLHWPAGSDAVLAQLNGIQIVDSGLSDLEVRPGEEIAVEVLWQVRIPPDQDLTTFVHLGDPTQEPLSQGDSPPLRGYYPTNLWAEDEVIDDLYHLELPDNIPPGRYPVYIGLYDRDSGVRLPVYIGNQRQSKDAYLVGWVSVE
jgi:hypothetical protein